jgi:spore coat polysaccharide biosynthesis predicted glycosyltransferase SpsG
MKTVAFFTEAGSKRGLGHFIRCKSLADGFIKRGYKVDFFIDSDIKLNNKELNYFKWQNINIAKKYDVIFIDSYEADKRIYKKISSYAKITVFIDDYARLDYPKGVILNFSFDAEDKFPIREKKHIYLLGSKYLLLRELFLKIQSVKRKYIFIMLGGSDVKKLSFKIVKLLKDVSIMKVVVTNDKDMQKRLKSLKNTIVLYKPSEKKLIKFMSNARVAITTASMSLYELSYLKVPTIAITVSKDQNLGIKTLLKYKVATDYIDILKSNWKVKIKQKSIKLLKQKNIAIASVDGLGTKRVIDFIEERLQ